MFQQGLQHADVFVIRDVHPSYRKGMQVFWWYGVLIAFVSAFVDSYVTLYLLAFGATNLQVGSLASISSFLAMLAPLIGAQWTARLGKRKPVFMVSLSLQYFMLLLAVLAPGVISGPALIPVLIGLMALRSGVSGIGSPAWTSLAGDIVPMERRGRYFSSRKTVMAIVTMFSVPLAGQIIDRIGAPAGYQLVFGIAVGAAAAAVFIYGRIPEPESAEGRRHEKVWAALRQALFANPLFLRFTLIALFWNLSTQLAAPYFSVFQVEVLKSTPAIIGALGTLSALTDVIGRQVFGRVIDRRGARWAFALCTLLIPILPFMWIPLTRPWHVIFVMIPNGFLWAGFDLSNFNLQLELSEAKYRTQAIAAHSSLISLANVMAPLLGAQVIETWGYDGDFALSGVGRLVAAGLFLLLLRPFGRGSLAAEQNGTAAHHG
ncbi:MAG: MFS transporter [Anaerolineae bacterium]|nr:MFS transporter [Anaerolineae bacterium]